MLRLQRLAPSITVFLNSYPFHSFSRSTGRHWTRRCAPRLGVCKGGLPCSSPTLTTPLSSCRSHCHNLSTSSAVSASFFKKSGCITSSLSKFSLPFSRSKVTIPPFQPFSSKRAFSDQQPDDEETGIMDSGLFFLPSSLHSFSWSCSLPSF